MSNGTGNGDQIIKAIKRNKGMAISGTGGSLLALYMALAGAGAVDRPVFVSEVREMRQAISANAEANRAGARDRVQIRIDIMRGNLSQGKIAADRYTREGQPVPAWLFQQNQQMENRIRDLERERDALR